MAYLKNAFVNRIILAKLYLSVILRDDLIIKKKNPG